MANPIFALDIYTERFLSERCVRVDFVFLSEDADSYRRVRWVEKHPMHWIADGILRAEAIPLNSYRNGSFSGPVERYSFDRPTLNAERSTVYGMEKAVAVAKRVFRKLDAIHAEEGAAADFPAYLARLAKATGAKHAWLARDFAASERVDGARLVPIAHAVHAVRSWIEAATALGREQSTADAAQ